jgi:hypothetical protein
MKHAFITLNQHAERLFVTPGGAMDKGFFGCILHVSGHKTPTCPKCYTGRNKCASSRVLQHEMPQASNSPRFRRTAIVVTLPALLLVLGMALGHALKSTAHRAVGLMPEVVCTADRTFNIVNEIVVRASRPMSAGALARLSGINK